MERCERRPVYLGLSHPRHPLYPRGQTNLFIRMRTRNVLYSYDIFFPPILNFITQAIFTNLPYYAVSTFPSLNVADGLLDGSWFYT